jgi:hypothetical protein
MHQCFICNSTKTYLHKGKYPRWHKKEILNNFILWFCLKCYDKYIKRPHYIPTTRYRFGLSSRQDIRDISRRFNAKRYRFGHLKILGDGPQRTGICSQCDHSIAAGTCHKTDMHHIYYLRICPWFGRVELCHQCHRHAYRDRYHH